MAQIGIVVITSLGTAIAKYILKSWIDSDLLDEFADEFVDLVRDKVKQTTEQRRQQKEIDKLAAAMATRMRQVYNASSLADNSKQSVALEVARTLHNFETDVREIVAHHMDVEELTKSILASRPDATKLFNVDEITLYERLIHAAAFAQVKSASLLASFPGIFASQIFKDIEHLTLLIEKVVQEPSEEAQSFAKKYNETIKRKLDQLEVFGLPKLDHYSHQQSLSVAYISLDVNPIAELPISDTLAWLSVCEAAKESEPIYTLVEDALSITNLSKVLHSNTIRHTASHGVASSLMLRYWSDRLEYEITSRLNSVESILSGKRRVVLQGQAGSGKTTLLQWLAVRAAAGDFEPPLSHWNQSIPFFIRLREYVDEGFPAPEDFLEKMAPMIAGRMPDNWVHEILDSGLGLVLIDGVDELPQDQRNTMLARLADLVETYPASRYIVSSRPAALKEQLWPQWKEWVESEGFVTTTLRDMDSTLVAIFIDQWHKALAASEDDDENKVKITGNADNLKSLLNGRPPLRRLAKNPLLCAMICALHHERLQNLPSERLKLYEECVEMLLTRRDEGRRVSTDYDYPVLSPQQRQTLIQDLSYWMFTNGYSDVTVESADQRFERKLPALGKSDITGEQIRRFFVDRTNLLREPVVGRVDFAHLTFQEYLAAREALEEGDFGVLEEHADDDKWREVIVLVVGLARKKEREEILNAILRKSHRQNILRAKRQQFALLALACLETSVSLDPNLREEILQNAASAIPPSDDDEAKMVAAAGDPAIQLLTPKETYSEEESVACVKTLAMIGSESAMEQLVEYAKDTRKKVRQALVTAWDNFNRDQYAQKVLGTFNEISIRNEYQLRGIRYLKNLSTLTLLKPPSDAGAFLELSELPDIEKLDIRSVEKTFDFSSLSSIKSLRALGVYSSNSIPELANLDQMQQLTCLTILALPLYGSLQPISQLTNLIELSIGIYSGEPSEFESFQSLCNLQNLTILSNKDAFDPRSIADLTQLTALKILAPSVPQPLRSLATLSNLKELAIPIDFNSVDCTTFAALENLTDLTLQLHSDPDFEQLTALTNLRRLKIISQKQLDINAISVLTQITHLDLSRCDVIDIAPVTHLPNLTNLILKPDHGFDLGEFVEQVSIHTQVTGTSDIYESFCELLAFSNAAVTMQTSRFLLQQIKGHSERVNNDS